MIKTEGEAIKHKNLNEQGKIKVDQLKKEAEAAKKIVATSTDPADAKKAVTIANKVAADASKEAAIQKSKQKEVVKPKENVAEAAAKADFMLLKSRACFRLASMNAQGDVVALHADRQDLYHPRKTGVFNVEVRNLMPGTLNQQWSYDAVKKVIRSRLYPNKVLSEGSNHNLFLYDFLDMDIQKFVFDMKNGII